MAGSAMLIFGALGLPTALATKSPAREDSMAEAGPDAPDGAEDEARDDA